jgi:hypothetical protein
MNGVSAFGLFVAGGVALVSSSCPFALPMTDAVDSSCEHFHLNSELERHHELFNGAMIALAWLMTLRFFDGYEIPGWQLQSICCTVAQLGGRCCRMQDEL